MNEIDEINKYLLKEREILNEKNKVEEVSSKNPFYQSVINHKHLPVEKRVINEIKPTSRLPIQTNKPAVSQPSHQISTAQRHLKSQQPVIDPINTKPYEANLDEDGNIIQTEHDPFYHNHPDREKIKQKMASLLSSSNKELDRTLHSNINCEPEKTKTLGDFVEKKEHPLFHLLSSPSVVKEDSNALVPVVKKIEEVIGSPVVHAVNKPSVIRVPLQEQTKHIDTQHAIASSIVFPSIKKSTGIEIPSVVEMVAVDYKLAIKQAKKIKSDEEKAKIIVKKVEQKNKNVVLPFLFKIFKVCLCISFSLITLLAFFSIPGANSYYEALSPWNRIIQAGLLFASLVFIYHTLLDWVGSFMKKDELLSLPSAPEIERASNANVG